MKASTVWALVGVLLILVGGAVGLTYAGRDIQSVMYLYTGLAGLAAGLVSSFLQVRKLSQKTDRQTEKLDEIHEQTNGVMDEKIERVVRMVLSEYFNPKKR